MTEFPVPRIVHAFATRFSNAGYCLYIVGGAVRDFLLNRLNTDYDFTTDAEPQQVMKLFRSVIPTGIQHGTVTVLFQGSSFEVTTFRTEAGYTDRRHPDTVHFVRSLAEDLKRRDFTMNALAADAITGSIIDYHKGKEDIEQRIIRAIGDPHKRFSEDALRILRGCRFAAQLGFSIESDTAAAMADLATHLRYVSGERIRTELLKILESPIPSQGFLALHACGALAVILPELSQGDQVAQKGAHQLDVMHHGIAACDAVPRHRPLVRLAALLHDIGKVETKRMADDGEVTFHRHEALSAKMAQNILSRLKFSNDEKSTVINLINNHMFHYTPDWSDGAVRRFVKRVGKHALEDVFMLRLADQMATDHQQRPQQILALKQRIADVLQESTALSIKDLAINGNDLAALGIPKGPTMGIILNQLLETVLDDPHQNTVETLSTIAQNFYTIRIKEPQEH
jgi:putative nucleotidyltransferase with HDIG domain